MLDLQYIQIQLNEIRKKSLMQCHTLMGVADERDGLLETIEKVNQ